MKNDIQITNCTFAKSILMILIVCYHSCAIWTNNWGELPHIQAPGIGIFAEWLNTFHIYCFTLISGYIFYYKKFEKKEYTLFTAFVYKKMKRLLVPFLVVGIMWIIPFEMYFSNKEWNFIFKYLLGISTSQLWFLLMLFNVFIIAFILNPLICKSNLLSVIISTLTWFIGKIGAKHFVNIFQIFTSFQFLLYFILGMKLRQYKNILQHLLKANVIIFLCMGDFILFLITRFKLFDFAKLNNMNTIVLHVLGAVTAFTCFQMFANVLRNGKRCYFFETLMTYSFPIFLFHQQIIYITNSFFDGVFNPYLNAVFNIGISLFGSLLISKFLYKSRVCRTLLGG